MSNFVTVYDTEGNPQEVRPQLAADRILYDGWTHEKPQKNKVEDEVKEVEEKEVTRKKFRK